MSCEKESLGHSFIPKMPKSRRAVKVWSKNTTKSRKELKTKLQKAAKAHLRSKSTPGVKFGTRRGVLPTAYRHCPGSKPLYAPPSSPKKKRKENSSKFFVKDSKLDGFSRSHGLPPTSRSTSTSSSSTERRTRGPGVNVGAPTLPVRYF
jgi:hypothetical protein